MQQIIAKLEPYTGFLSKTLFIYPLPRGFEFQFSYFQAGLTVLMLFLLILTLGQLRHRFLHWHMEGVIPGVIFGFIIALLLEGILIIGGRTILIEVLGWKSAPKPISNALDAGRNKMVSVLGVRLEKKSVTTGEMMSLYQELDEEDKESLQQFLCE